MNFLKTSILSVALFLVSQAAMAKVTCYTPRMSKKIVIEDNRIAFSKPFLQARGLREVASTSAVRTKYLGKGFEKVVFNKGQKNIIHIEDAKNFSEIDDYLLVRSAEGHEMTYPLTCKG